MRVKRDGFFDPRALLQVVVPGEAGKRFSGMAASGQPIAQDKYQRRP
jgi:hypothetical protein